MNQSPPPTKAPRVWFVDALRLIASFQMVNGHTLHAVLAPAWREGAFYGRYLWFRGLIAVAFLLVSGIAFHLSTVARFERHRTNALAIRRRFRRALIIIAFGFALSFPAAAFGDDPEAAAAAWRHFLAIDILPCIGMSLLVMEIIVLLAPSPRFVVALAGAAALCCFLLAPAADALITDGEPHPFLSWFSHQAGSQFPLLPWSGYVFAGVVVGGFVLPQAGYTLYRRTLSRMALLVASAAAVWLTIEPLSNALYDGARHHPATSPALTSERLLVVLAALMVLDFLCRPIRAFPGWLRTLAAETLTIYVFHLVLIYTVLLGLADLLGQLLPTIDLDPRRSLDLFEALGLSAVNLAITIAFALWWHRWQRRGGFRTLMPRRAASGSRANGGSPPDRD